MTIREAAAALGADILHDEFNDITLSGAYTSDLLSDVLANANKTVKLGDANTGGALITIQAHKNTVAVATVVNVSAIIICNSRPIPEDMLTAAKGQGIALLLSKENQYVVSGKLYQLLASFNDADYSAAPASRRELQ